MEKYGVEETESTKKANEDFDKSICPDCGAALRNSEQTGVLICPRCGTKPFEK
jgi:predicted RNA-binding Zn-ribbon protein involved in translation (DUF1610 family)